jgi:hypothetical protein
MERGGGVSAPEVGLSLFGPNGVARFTMLLDGLSTAIRTGSAPPRLDQLPAVRRRRNYDLAALCTHWCAKFIDYQGGAEPAGSRSHLPVSSSRSPTDEAADDGYVEDLDRRLTPPWSRASSQCASLTAGALRPDAASAQPADA